MPFIPNPREQALEMAVTYLTDKFTEAGDLANILAEADLQPTETAARCAAVAAVAVLFAHDAGQDVGRDARPAPKAGGAPVKPPKAAPSGKRARKMYPFPHCEKAFQTRGLLSTHVARHHSDSV